MKYSTNQLILQSPTFPRSSRRRSTSSTCSGRRKIPDILDATLEHLPNLQGIWTRKAIRHDEAAETARAAGVTVVHDRCIRTQDIYRQYGGGTSAQEAAEPQPVGPPAAIGLQRGNRRGDLGPPRPEQRRIDVTPKRGIRHETARRRAMPFR